VLFVAAEVHLPYTLIVVGVVAYRVEFLTVEGHLEAAFNLFDDVGRQPLVINPEQECSTHMPCLIGDAYVGDLFEAVPKVGRQHDSHLFPVVTLVEEDVVRQGSFGNRVHYH